jgi:hypothetical protein
MIFKRSDSTKKTLVIIRATTIGQSPILFIFYIYYIKIFLKSQRSSLFFLTKEKIFSIIQIETGGKKELIKLDYTLTSPEERNELVK